MPLTRTIRFSDEEMRAKQKTQVRRVIRPQPEHKQVHEVLYDGEHRLWWQENHAWDYLLDSQRDRDELAARCPYGQPGDHLRVRPGVILEITVVRVERVQEITEGDAQEEGLQDWYPPINEPNGAPYTTSKRRFRDFWNTHSNYTWDQNPWVWVISYKKITS